MLAHYLTYLLVAGVYYYALASFATVAAAVGSLPLLAFFGTFVLGGVAAPLVILQSRMAVYATLIALAMLGPWVIGLAIETLAAPWPESLFALAVIGPVAAALILAVRSLRGRSVARVAIPTPVRYLLVIPPAGIVAYLAYYLVSGLAQMSAA